jgi:PBP1b-binding outer membrane lipoprotein LpoB
MKSPLVNALIISFSALVLVGCQSQSVNTQKQMKNSETVQQEPHTAVELTGNEAILKKACEDLAYSIPRTDPSKPEEMISVDEVWTIASISNCIPKLNLIP